MQNEFDTLPLVIAPINSIKNPDWRSGDDPSLYYLPAEMREAEVLMLNVNAGTMRVRSPNKEWNTQDVDIKWFFESYQIVKK